MTEPDLTPSQQAMMKTLADHGKAEIIDRDLDATLATMTENPLSICFSNARRGRGSRCCPRLLRTSDDPIAEGSQVHACHAHNRDRSNSQ